MKIAITGHTSGLGKALKERFELAGHTVIGFCITTGYDISDSEVRNKIVVESADCDVFINNAYSPKSQYPLLDAVYKSFINTDKIIINIGSRVIESARAQHEHSQVWLNYYNEKIKLQEFVKNKQVAHKPRILNVLPGWMDTAMATGHNGPKANVVDVADLIYHVFSLRDKLLVHEISFSSVE